MPVSLRLQTKQPKWVSKRSQKDHAVGLLRRPPKPEFLPTFSFVCRVSRFVLVPSFGFPRKAALLDTFRTSDPVEKGREGSKKNRFRRPVFRLKTCGAPEPLLEECRARKKLFLAADAGGPETRLSETKEILTNYNTLCTEGKLRHIVFGNATLSYARSVSKKDVYRKRRVSKKRNLQLFQMQRKSCLPSHPSSRSNSRNANSSKRENARLPYYTNTEWILRRQQKVGQPQIWKRAP